MNINALRQFVKTRQDAEGSFISENSVKTTAEYLLVHRFCPQINVGDVEKAKTYLKRQLPYFALSEVTKGFTSMEKIWQIAVGIPEETQVLSGEVLKLCLSGAMPVSVKSSLLLLLFLEKVQVELDDILKEVIEYQKALFRTVSLDSLYETTHNVMTFSQAQTHYEVRDIIDCSCEWLSENVLSLSRCIDLVAETAGVFSLCNYTNENTELFSFLDHQNEDGGFPVFVGGTSEIHPSLVTLWAVTAYNPS
jgi:hypothetical protein